MKPNCFNCFNKRICKLYESANELQSQFNDAIIVIEKCPYHRLKNDSAVKEPIANSVKPNCKDMLNSLGLCEEKDNNFIQEEAPVLNGKLCPSCNKILGPEKFADDVCNNCGHHICIDCAYHVSDSILCEECF